MTEKGLRSPNRRRVEPFIFTGIIRSIYCFLICRRIETCELVKEILLYAESVVGGDTLTVYIHISVYLSLLCDMLLV